MTDLIFPCSVGGIIIQIIIISWHLVLNIKYKNLAECVALFDHCFILTNVLSVKEVTDLPSNDLSWSFSFIIFNKYVFHLYYKQAIQYTGLQDFILNTLQIK